jgi:hypothetical protein
VPAVGRVPVGQCPVTVCHVAAHEVEHYRQQAAKWLPGLKGKYAPMTVPSGGPLSVQAKEAATSVPTEAARTRAKPWFQHLARLGLATRAMIYALLAYIAAEIALTHSAPAPASGSGALTEVRKQSAGRVLLGLLAVGLVAYALWRVAQTLSRANQDNGDGQESSAGGAFKRAGFLASAVVYFFLCGQAASLALSATGAGSSGGPSSHPQPLVATVLRWPGGPVWVGLVGSGIAVAGAALVVWGCLHDYSEVLETDRMGPSGFRAALVTGVVGEAARGLLIVLVAVYLLSAAIANNPSRAKSLNGALLSFDRLTAGPPLLLMAVAGLASFAVYSVFEAVYRRV